MLIGYVIGSNIVNRMPQVLNIHLGNSYNLSACASCKPGANSFVQFTNINTQITLTYCIRVIWVFVQIVSIHFYN